MNQRIDIFREDFLQSIFGAAEAQEDFLESAFVEQYAKELEESGEIDDEVQLSHWSQRGIKVDAYSYNEDEGILNLFISVFATNLEEKSLTQTAVDQAFNRLKGFFTQAYSKYYYSQLEEATSVYDLAYTIHKNKKNISKVKFYLLSNKILNDKVNAIQSYENDEIEFSFHIWDISRLFRMDSSNQKKEEILINFEEISSEPIYCLPAHLNTDEYQSYLLVVPGTLLAGLYGKYGARLLEQNVRTFLQARGKVNKGLRNTIINQPEKFFAYNNGLTTTAEAIEIEPTENGLRLKSLKNLQIVNGGQTTASIYNAMKKDKAQLDHLFVQMKLTIVKPEEAEELVPKISEYANTQNNVNAADFFSNHPFHVRIEDFSRRIYAPATDGGHKQTKWFYERARGQYLDAQVNKTEAERKRFQLEYPKRQLFTKTDLSKFENVWQDIPHIVAQGAQNSFVKYASDIGKRWEKSDIAYNEHYFKTAIAKAIIFKTTETLISEAYWYDGGYRAQTVAYTIGYLDYAIKQQNKFFDFLTVWNKQSVSNATVEALKLISKAVYDELTNPPSGIANISQWAKKEGCWHSMKKLSVDLPNSFFIELIDTEEAKEDVKEAKKVQRIDNGIEAQKLVFKIAEQGKWCEIKKFGIDNEMLTEQEVELMEIACSIPNKIPSEKQSLKIIHTFHNLEDIGLSV
ncbi:AIPR family protein [Sulfuricurvum sp. IAE1]|uniref:AIPR family protein n=1 Tax=Sulfuricurvum sp. IAE1 TaxID=2546102 RepID=UPI001042FD94|nr:AIPR family protein [Sulfuricurvum sp. IAE1]TDA62490.1 AIPR family protein [Sulfuricurvum sp. IAE1]